VDVQEVAVSSLEGLGYEVVAAENGPAALDVLARVREVDLVLVDMAMPGMNGVEFIERARERHPKLPAVLVTGYADVAAFSPAEGDLVLQKPYRLERLADAVAEALHRPEAQLGVKRRPHEGLDEPGIGSDRRSIR
jgi:CheY-like chemotaxis protein